MEISSVTSSQREKEYNNTVRVRQYTTRFKEDSVKPKKNFLDVSYCALILHILTTRSFGFTIFLIPFILFTMLTVSGVCGVYYAAGSPVKTLKRAIT